MKTRYDLLYDFAARLGCADVSDAELVFERLRADGRLCFDGHVGYRIDDGVDLLASYELAIAERRGDLISAADVTDHEHTTMRAWLFAVAGNQAASATCER